MAGDEQFLSRGIDHLGLLGAKLRDLRGFNTLAYELIQNANDAPGASSMSFRLTEDALFVDNDGRFTDCGHVQASECPWRTSKGHRCDFHRFRLVASGDKREQADTIGAFGIGFIAVYQITDQPELISGGRHWILHEDRREDERIGVCPGCSICKASSLPGTRFILPWARDPQSTLRSQLRAEIPPSDATTRLTETLLRCAPTAMLFLSRITSIEIIHDGHSRTRFARRIDGESVHISDSVHDHVWYLLQGDFSDRATELKQLHAGKIESKRSGTITLAVSTSSLDRGVFCAFLPTEHETGLPFHINADFFTTSDRKRIILEADYQSEFNRAAIQAAAITLGRNLARLPTLLGPDRLWALLERARRVGQEAKTGHCDRSLGKFWAELAAQLPRTPVVFTTRGEWRRPAEVRLLEREEEEAAAPAIEELGIPLVHPCLRPFHNLLRERDVTAVQYLDIPDIVTKLLALGLTARRLSSDLPPSLLPPEHRETLMSELTILLRRQRPAEMQQRVRTALATCALAPARDEAFWPFREVYRADDVTISLFGRILPTLPFLADRWRQAEPFTSLCPAFSATAAIEALDALGAPELTSASERGDLMSLVK